MSREVVTFIVGLVLLLCGLRLVSRAHRLTTAISITRNRRQWILTAIMSFFGVWLFVQGAFIVYMAFSPQAGQYLVRGALLTFIVFSFFAYLIWSATGFSVAPSGTEEQQET